MSAQALMGDIFYEEEMTEDLDRLPEKGWIKGMQDLCKEIMRTMPDAFHLIPHRFKTQEMCEKAAEDESETLEYVSDQLKTPKKCVKK